MLRLMTFTIYEAESAVSGETVYTTALSPTVQLRKAYSDCVQSVVTQEYFNTRNWLWTQYFVINLFIAWVTTENCRRSVCFNYINPFRKSREYFNTRNWLWTQYFVIKLFIAWVTTDNCRRSVCFNYINPFRKSFWMQITKFSSLLSRSLLSIQLQQTSGLDIFSLDNHWFSLIF